MPNDKSDILIVLENIERVIQCYNYPSNSVAQKLMVLALAFEAQSLADKIQLACQRWVHKLPFKEGCDVNIPVWLKNIDHWIKTIKNKTNAHKENAIAVPSDYYYFDQYFLLKEKEENVQKNGHISVSYETQDIDTYNLSIKKTKLKFDADGCKYRSMLDAAIINHIPSDYGTLAETLKAIHENENPYQFLFRALKALQIVLKRTEQTLLTPSDEAFRMLYERLLGTYYKGLVRKTRDSVEHWIRSAPTVNTLNALEVKFKKETDKFFSGKWEKGLRLYFDIDHVERFTEGVDAGKFIFKYRKELSIEELRDILTGCHKLNLYHQEICKLKPNLSSENSRQVAKELSHEKEEFKLPNNFATSLRQNTLAIQLFVQILRNCEPTISKRNGTTWGHVKQAFTELNLLDKCCSGVDFGSAIHYICPNREASSVEQAIKRYNSRNLHTIDKHKEQGIIESFKTRFQPVMEQLNTIS